MLFKMPDSVLQVCMICQIVKFFLFFFYLPYLSHVQNNYFLSITLLLLFTSKRVYTISMGSYLYLLIHLSLCNSPTEDGIENVDSQIFICTKDTLKSETQA